MLTAGSGGPSRTASILTRHGGGTHPVSASTTTARELTRRGESAQGSRSPGRTPPSWLGNVVAVAAVAGGVFAIGFESGGYGLATRSAVGVGTWLAVLVASTFVHRPLHRLGGVGGTTCALLAAFAAESGASALWGESAELAIDEFARLVLFLGLLVLVLLFSTRSQLARWCDGVALGIVAVGALALGSRLFPEAIHGLPPLGFLTGLQTRLAYPLGYWTALGVLVALGLPLLLRLAVDETSLLVRGAALVPVPALVAVLYLTSARLAVLVAAVGVVGYLLLSRRRWSVLGAAAASGCGSVVTILILRNRPELVNGPFGTPTAIADGRAAALLIAAAGVVPAVVYVAAARRLPQPPALNRRPRRVLLLILAAGIVATVALSHPVARFDAFRSTPPGLLHEPVAQHLLSGSSNGRWQLWTSAVHEFVHYPLLGHGAGSFQAWWLQHGSGFYVKNAHSLFLEQLGGLGIVGGLLLVAFFAVPLAAAVKCIREDRPTREPVAAAAATLAAFVVAAALDWMWEMTVVSVVGILCMGVLLRGVAEARPPGTAASRARRVAGVAAAVLACGALALEGVVVLGTHELSTSQAAAAAGNLATAQTAARSASRLEPWAESPYLQLALLEEQSGNAEGALSQVRSALARNPSDWQAWIVAARIERTLGRTAESKRSLARVTTLNPTWRLLTPPRSGGG